MTSFPPLRLKPQEERRLKAGHLWIYSNEIDTHTTPLSEFIPGQLVQIENAHGYPLGIGYINPNTLLCARLLTRDTQQTIDQNFFIQRLQRALRLRELLFNQPFYRLIYGESDGLPGLIIDRYATVFVVQLNTAGMARLQESILNALKAVFNPTGIVLRNDSTARTLENLPQSITIAFGNVPDEIILTENNSRFYTSLTHGQKTGWFYDHRDNRARMIKYVEGKRVLDLFSYVGAWGIQAAMHGAQQVVCVDSSAPALELLQRNAALNEVSDKVSTLQADVFDYLKTASNKELFDVIVIDPPAFIKKRKDLKTGLVAYHQLNKLVMNCLNNEGFLITASCSLHLESQQLLDAVRRAGIALQRPIQILEQGHQAADHPIHPTIPETAYLKAFFCRVT